MVASNEPFNESFIASANLFVVPSLSNKILFNLETSSVPLNKVANAVTLLLSVNSNIPATSTPLASNSCNAGINSSTDEIPRPNSIANAPVGSANFKNIFFNAVADVDASIPVSAKTPNNDVVSSNENPICFANVATFGIATENFSKSNNEFENDAAITSVTLDASDASKLNAFNVTPTCVAVVDKSFPNANAKSKIDDVMDSISVVLKPAFANSTCNPATSPAANDVDEPNSFAWSDSRSISTAVAPEITPTCLI